MKSDTSDLVIHSTDQPLSELSKIGFKTADWMTTLKPHAWEYPSYAAPEGVGKAFVIVRPADRIRLSCV